MESTIMKKKSKYHSLKVASAIILIAIVALAVTFAVQSANNRFKGTMTVEEAQSFVDDRTGETSEQCCRLGAKYVAENSKVTVNSVSYGNERNIILDCSYETLDIGTVVETNVEKYVADAYSFYIDNKNNGIKTNATKIKLRSHVNA